jgi:hypothetical protein
MPGRNQPRYSRGRSAIARRAINTGNTNGMMYQGTCIAEDGTKITPCHNFGGMKKGGAPPSATGFMRARPWQISVPAKRKNFLFRMNTSQVTTEQAKSTSVCTLDRHCPEYHHCHPNHTLADKNTGCMKYDDMHVDDPTQNCSGKGQYNDYGSTCDCKNNYVYASRGADQGALCRPLPQNDDGFCYASGGCNCVHSADADNGGCP